MASRPGNLAAVDSQENLEPEPTPPEILLEHLEELVRLKTATWADTKFHAKKLQFLLVHVWGNENKTN